MIPSLQKTYDASGIRASRHQVLRNTYWLLALSMIPTVLGAFVGLNFFLPIFFGGMGVLLFFVIAFGFIFAIEKTKNSAAGVPVLLAFTFFMGFWLTPLLRFTLHFANGGALIMTAFTGTAVVFAVMATVATVSKRDFSGLGSWLTAGAIVVILAAFANMFLHLPSLMLAVSTLAMVIFSGFILFDVQRIINGGETNYISATLRIYLDIYNVFTSMLQLLGIGFGQRD